MNDRFANVDESVVHMLISASGECPDGEALVCGEQRLNYSDYVTSVSAFATELAAIGVAGERVVTLLGNSIDACIAFFAVHSAGAQLVSLNPMYTAHELAHILTDCDPAVIVADAAFAEKINRTLAEAGLSVVTVYLDSASSLIRMNQAADTPVMLPQASDLALLQYTGGTTGTPKGVDLTHGAVVTNVHQREALLPTRAEGERILGTMPIFHTYGLSMQVYLSVRARGTLVLLPEYVRGRVLDTIETEQITILAASPTVFLGLMAHPEFETTDWSSVTTCYSGASALPADTLARWELETGTRVYEGYGQSEAGPVIAFNPAGGVSKASSVGIPVPGTQIEIVDMGEGLDVLAVDQPGEIRVKGPQLMRGYRGRPAETAAALRDGWLYTGDIGRIDEDGYLFILGRLKEMILVSGYNVYPREIEELLMSRPDVMEAAVIGVPDDYRGEQVLAFVVVTPGSEVSDVQLRKYCQETLVKYKVPSEVRMVDALPKTGVSKTDKLRLKRMLVDENAGHGPESPGSSLADETTRGE